VIIPKIHGTRLKETVSRPIESSIYQKGFSIGIKESSSGRIWYSIL